MVRRPHAVAFFFFNDTATTEIYTLSLHDALPISRCRRSRPSTTWRAPTSRCSPRCRGAAHPPTGSTDRKSTRLNSSHLVISYAVFCLKKKKNTRHYMIPSVHMRLAHAPDAQTAHA